MSLHLIIWDIFLLSYLTGGGGGRGKEMERTAFGHTGTTAHIWRSEDNYWESTLL